MFIIFFWFIWFLFFSVYYKYYLTVVWIKKYLLLIHIFTGVIIIILTIIIWSLLYLNTYCVSVYCILNVSTKSKDVIIVVILNYDTFEWDLLQQSIETNSNKTWNTDFGLLHFNMFMILSNIFIGEYFIALLVTLLTLTCLHNKTLVMSEGTFIVKGPGWRPLSAAVWRSSRAALLLLLPAAAAAAVPLSFCFH